MQCKIFRVARQEIKSDYCSFLYFYCSLIKIIPHWAGLIKKKIITKKRYFISRIYGVIFFEVR